MRGRRFQFKRALSPQAYLRELRKEYAQLVEMSDEEYAEEHPNSTMTREEYIEYKENEIDTATAKWEEYSDWQMEARAERAAEREEFYEREFY